MSFKVYVVEDHPLMREMLAEFIAETTDLNLCGEAATGEEALEHVEEAGPDLVLIDVSLPRMSGIDLVRELQVRQPHLPCLMLSGHQETTYVERALSAGARGYILKGDPFEIPDAIRHVLDGGTYLSETMRGRIWNGHESDGEKA